MIDSKIVELQSSQNMPFVTTLEIEVNRVGDKNFKLPNDTDLSIKKIIGMYITFPSDTQAVSRNGKPLLPLSDMNNAYLTLTSCGKDFVKNAPLSMFNVAGKPLLYVPVYADGLTLRDSELCLGEKLKALTQNNGTSTINPDYVVQITFVHL